MKNIIIFCTLIIILFIIIFLKQNKRENFVILGDSLTIPVGNGTDLKPNINTFYRPVTIQLTEPVVNSKIITTFVESSLYWAIGNILSKIYPLKLQTGEGSYDNIKKLINKEANFAIAQEDVVLDAVLGRFPFKRPHKELTFCCSLFYEKVCLIVNPRFGIKSWRDLKGKTVCFGLKGSGSYINAIELCKLIGINKDDMNIINGSIYEKKIIDLVLDDKIHAIYFTGEQPDIQIISLIRVKLLTIIGSNGLPDDFVKARFPNWDNTTINLDNYGIPSGIENINSYAVKAILICNANEDFSTVYKLINTIFLNILYIRKNIGNKIYTGVLEEYSLSNMFAHHQVIPIHKAILKYYKNVGMISNNSNPGCIYFAGTGNCNPEILNYHEENVNINTIEEKIAEPHGKGWVN